MTSELQLPVPVIDVSEYCRDLETHLCRKNDGHLIRIVGPSFEIVSRWAATGVPLKVAMTQQPASLPSVCRKTAPFALRMSKQCAQNFRRRMSPS